MTTRWEQKATSLWQGWLQATSSAPPNPNALYQVLAQAQHESIAGDCWDKCGNWGACDLRSLNLQEQTAFKEERLKIGDWLYPDNSFGSVHRVDSIGTVRGDSDPNSGPFHVWFACFPTDQQGAAYMLRAGVRSAKSVFEDPNCTPYTYAKALYTQSCYFGGVHKGSRPCGHRPDPLNAAEEANVNDYAGAIAKLLPEIVAALAAWTPPGDYAQTPFGENVTPNQGDEVVDTHPSPNAGSDPSSSSG